MHTATETPRAEPLGEREHHLPVRHSREKRLLQMHGNGVLYAVTMSFWHSSVGGRPDSN